MLAPELIKYIDDLMRADLLYWRDLWFGWLLYSTKVVVLGLVMEAPELLYEIVFIRRSIHLDESGGFLRESHVPDWAKVVALLGWLLIVGGVAGEWITSGIISTAEGNIQTFNNILLREAIKSAGDAKTSAEGAASAAFLANRAAKEANGEARTAVERSNEATASASNALGLAEGARQEADSFEKDIRDAQTRAASAESHLADALRRAAEATEELDRIRLPRSLTRQTELTVKLGPFIGMEYTFSSVSQDDESIRFLRILDAALQGAGWKRVKPPPSGFSAINVYGSAVDFAVPVGFGTGVSISTESRESISSLKALQVAKLPPHVQAAVVLNKALFESISPSELIKRVPLVVVRDGDSTVVDIAVGKKM